MSHAPFRQCPTCRRVAARPQKVRGARLPRAKAQPDRQKPRLARDRLNGFLGREAAVNRPSTHQYPLEGARIALFETRGAGVAQRILDREPADRDLRASNLSSGGRRRTRSTDIRRPITGRASEGPYEATDASAPDRRNSRQTETSDSPPGVRRMISYSLDDNWQAMDTSDGHAFRRD